MSTKASLELILLLSPPSTASSYPIPPDHSQPIAGLPHCIMPAHARRPQYTTPAGGIRKLSQGNLGRVMHGTKSKGKTGDKPSTGDNAPASSSAASTTSTAGITPSTTIYAPTARLYCYANPPCKYPNTTTTLSWPDHQRDQRDQHMTNVHPARTAAQTQRKVAGVKRAFTQH